MTTLLLDCSARHELSVSRELARYVVEKLDEPVIHRDLGASSFPALSGRDLIDMHGGNQIKRGSLEQHKAVAEELVSELKEVDTLVVGMPIYNFSVPASLKQWIDYVVRPRVTFRYESGSPVGLCKNIKQAYIVTSSGGTLVEGAMDFATPYLDFICRFIGVEKVVRIDAGGSKRQRDQIIDDAKRDIDRLTDRSVHKVAG